MKKGADNVCTFFHYYARHKAGLVRILDTGQPQYTYPQLRQSASKTT